jgi:hypothetical protein
MSSVFMISALLSFFGGILAIVVNVLRSFMEVYSTAPKLGDALHFMFGLDAYAVRLIPWPQAQDFTLLLLQQPLWASLFAFALILAFLSRLTAKPSQAT